MNEIRARWTKPFAMSPNVFDPDLMQSSLQSGSGRGWVPGVSLGAFLLDKGVDTVTVGVAAEATASASPETQTQT